MRLVRTSGIVTAVCLVASGIAQAKTNWPLWEAYTARFLDQSGRIVDHDADDRTTSEGQSYALFFALVANDRERFNRILSWTKQNLAQGDLGGHLPAWQWKNGSGISSRSDRNSASDSDLWIAYTLCEAGRLWSDRELLETGRALAEKIRSDEVATVGGLGLMLLPGSFGFTNSDGSVEMNPSYLPIQLLVGLEHSLGDHAWGEIASHVPAVVRGASPSGFALDWVAFRPTDGFALYPVPAAAPVASYDAIRVYLWAGMADGRSPYREAVMKALGGMAGYMKSHSIPPEAVLPDGRIQSSNGGVGFSAALIPFLKACGLKRAAQEQRARLESAKDFKTDLFGQTPRYYDQNLALFATGWCEERFQFDAAGALKVSWSK